MKHELELIGKSPLRRILSLRLAADNFSVAVYPLRIKKNGYTSTTFSTIAWSSKPFNRCRLDIRHQFDCCLWCDGAAFDVTQTEAAKIRALYEPLGMKVVVETPVIEGVDENAAQSR